MEIKAPPSVITKPDKVADILLEILSSESEIDRDKEHFWVIGLNARNAIKYVDLVSLGDLNSSIVSPRETFRLAIMKGVASIIVAHNHPSESLKPSDQDIKITKMLKDAGEILRIKVLDHVIIAGDGTYCSMDRDGFM